LVDDNIFMVAIVVQPFNFANRICSSLSELARNSKSMFEIKVPGFGESIQEVQVASWLKQVGDWVNKDDDLVELESEKASQNLPSDFEGVLTEIKVANGEFAAVGDLLAIISPQEGGKPSSSQPAAAPVSPAAANAPATVATSPQNSDWIMPAAERILSQYQISADAITPTGPGGRLLKEDVLNYIQAKGLKPSDSAGAVAPAASVAPAAARVTAPTRPASPAPVKATPMPTSPSAVPSNPEASGTFEREEKAVPMSMIAKAVVEGLRRFPAINSEIRDEKIISKNFHDIGVAIGGGKGLVVPILRNVERMSFADVEQKIGEYAALAQENKIVPSDLQGGTFTISNGGVYGSLLSTPIVNPPQSGILGLHTIQDRPIALNGEVVIRPMMYVALTYDHRIVDGREAVGFLKTIKEVLEEPARLFLEV